MLFSLNEEGNPVRCYNINEPVTEGHLYSYYVSTIVKLIDAEHRMVVAKAWGKGKWGFAGQLYVHSLKFCFYFFV